MIHYNLDIFGISETNLTIKQSWHFTWSLDPSYHYYLSLAEHFKGSGVGLIVDPSVLSHIFNHFSYKGRFIYIDIQVKGKPYKKISCDFCSKNIQLKIWRFLYNLLCNKCAKFCNKSHKNHTEKTSDFFDQKSFNFCQI